MGQNTKPISEPYGETVRGHVLPATTLADRIPMPPVKPNNDGRVPMRSPSVGTASFPDSRTTQS